MKKPLNPYYFKMHYSISRYFVDEFLLQNINLFKKNSLILDLGGMKNNKRGQFNIESFPFIIKYLNIDPKTKPDFLDDAENIPVKNDYFDGIICSQLLEHVINPKKILKEAYRILKPSKPLLVTVPFLFRIHPDPNDYARYTDQYWEETFKEIGFENIKIKRLGTYFSVLADMIKNGTRYLSKNKIFKIKLFWLIIVFLSGNLIRLLFAIEKNKTNNKFLNSYTTGFGISARK